MNAGSWVGVATACVRVCIPEPGRQGRKSDSTAAKAHFEKPVVQRGGPIPAQDSPRIVHPDFPLAALNRPLKRLIAWP